MRTMPLQKPGKSDSTLRTPEVFLQAVRSRWGIISFAVDLAGPPDNNTKAWRVITKEEDSLAADWHELTGNLWLNPPYDRIEPWAKKCSETICTQRRIFFLVPASTGARWFQNYVHNIAKVYLLYGRLSFDLSGNPYPKDCILAVYGEPPGYELWDWRK